MKRIQNTNGNGGRGFFAYAYFGFFGGFFYGASRTE